jgi:hypothetical protein
MWSRGAFLLAGNRDRARLMKRYLADGFSAGGKVFGLAQENDHAVLDALRKR